MLGSEGPDGFLVTPGLQHSRAEMVEFFGFFGFFFGSCIGVLDPVWLWFANCMCFNMVIYHVKGV